MSALVVERLYDRHHSGIATRGLGYSGFASIMAVAVAPWIGLYVFDHGGWTLMCFEAAALNLIMAIIAWRLPKDVTHADAARRACISAT